MAALVNLKLNVKKRHGGQEHITFNYHITSYHIILHHCYIIFHHITLYCMTSPMLFVANRLYLPSPPELLTTKADLKGPHFVIASDPAYGHRSQRRLYIGEIGSNICQMCVYTIYWIYWLSIVWHISSNDIKWQPSQTPVRSDFLAIRFPQAALCRESAKLLGPKHVDFCTAQNLPRTCPLALKAPSHSLWQALKPAARSWKQIQVCKTRRTDCIVQLSVRAWLDLCSFCGEKWKAEKSRKKQKESWRNASNAWSSCAALWRSWQTWRRWACSRIWAVEPRPKNMFPIASSMFFDVLPYYKMLRTWMSRSFLQASSRAWKVCSADILRLWMTKWIVSNATCTGIAQLMPCERSFCLVQPGNRTTTEESGIERYWENETYLYIVFYSNRF